MERDRGRRRARMLVLVGGGLLGAVALGAGALGLSGGLLARAPQVDVVSQRLPDAITALDTATRAALTSPTTLARAHRPAPCPAVAAPTAKVKPSARRLQREIAAANRRALESAKAGPRSTCSRGPVPPRPPRRDGRPAAHAAKASTGRLTHSLRAAQRKLLRQSANRAARARARARRAAAKQHP
jgi:hypothetical protein